MRSASTSGHVGRGMEVVRSSPRPQDVAQGCSSVWGLARRVKGKHYGVVEVRRSRRTGAGCRPPAVLGRALGDLRDGECTRMHSAVTGAGPASKTEADGGLGRMRVARSVRNRDGILPLPGQAGGVCCRSLPADLSFLPLPPPGCRRRPCCCRLAGLVRRGRAKITLVPCRGAGWKHAVHAGGEW